MLNWYKSACVCYVYLEDVRVRKFDSTADKARKEAFYKDLELQVKRARWITRGWTLQELIASKHIISCDRDWNYVSSFPVFGSILAEAIGIPASILGSRGISSEAFAKTSLQERIFWARSRQTTRPEDRAYSMLGLLDVSMPMLYGEGAVKARKRLAREVKDEHGVELNFEALN